MSKTLNIKELRVGNWINYAYFLESLSPVQICALSEYNITYRITDLEDTSKEITYPIENFQGIPLTEELLNRFGAKHMIIKGDYILYELQLVEIKVLIRDPNIIMFDNKILRYLHQLQNICFDLGQELDIKL